MGERRIGQEALFYEFSLLQQTNRVQRGAQIFQPASYILAGPRVRQKPLTGRRWRVIALSDIRPVTRLLGQLERGLEEIHE